VSGVMLPVALFWFAWTSGPTIHWIAPTIALVWVGFSILGIFVSL
jgi:hypothetical protein